MHYTKSVLHLHYSITYVHSSVIDDLATFLNDLPMKGFLARMMFTAWKWIGYVIGDPWVFKPQTVTWTHQHHTHCGCRSALPVLAAGPAQVLSSSILIIITIHPCLSSSSVICSYHPLPSKSSKSSIHPSSLIVVIIRMAQPVGCCQG